MRSLMLVAAVASLAACAGDPVGPKAAPPKLSVEEEIDIAGDTKKIGHGPCDKGSPAMMALYTHNFDAWARLCSETPAEEEQP